MQLILCISSRAWECEGVMSDSLLFGVWISVDVYEVIFGGQLGFWRPPSWRITLRRHLARAFWNQTLENLIVKQTYSECLVAHLENSLWQSSLLCQLLQVLGIGILVDGEVRLHRSQLVVLERRAHSFISTVRRHRSTRPRRLTSIVRRHIHAARIQLRCVQQLWKEIFFN